MVGDLGVKIQGVCVIWSVSSQLPSDSHKQYLRTMKKKKVSTKSSLLAHVHARDERELVDKLRDLGLDQYVELPQIAVMGDTSSGKSSLLSAVSGVSSHRPTSSRCRSQRELSKGTTIEKGIAHELAFFREHEYWRRLPEHLWGVPNLSERLVAILQDNIRRSLPTVITEINDRVATAQSELAAMGTPLESLGAQRQQFCKWVNQYLRQMEAAMDGQYTLLSAVSAKDGAGVSSMAELSTRLHAVLRQKENVFQLAIARTKDQVAGTQRGQSQEDVAVGDAVQIQIDGKWHNGTVKQTNGTDICCEEFAAHWKSKRYWRFDEHAKLKKFIRENRGDELAIFPSYQVFCNLFRRCVDDWSPPTQQLVNDYRVQTKLVSDH
ncbi:hypothetical protein BBJ28_00008150, partial [Nothophytophthora sp. Chile5]